MPKSRKIHECIFKIYISYLVSRLRKITIYEQDLLREQARFLRKFQKRAGPNEGKQAGKLAEKNSASMHI